MAAKSLPQKIRPSTRDPYLHPDLLKPDDPRLPLWGQKQAAPPIFGNRQSLSGSMLRDSRPKPRMQRKPPAKPAWVLGPMPQPTPKNKIELGTINRKGALLNTPAQKKLSRSLGPLPELKLSPFSKSRRKQPKPPSVSTNNLQGSTRNELLTPFSR